MGTTANFTYPFKCNEPILFYGCFKRTNREEVAINGKHEATCWDLVVRSMACFVMPLQTNISRIPFQTQIKTQMRRGEFLLSEVST